MSALVSSGLTKARRATLLAKRLRARYGLTVDLTVPCCALKMPELYDGPPWAELVDKLASYEVIVWRSFVLSLRRLAGESAVKGNTGFAPRR